MTVLSAEGARQQSSGLASWALDEKAGKSWKDGTEAFVALSASAAMLPIPQTK
jgi:hypothetical protein